MVRVPANWRRLGQFNSPAQSGRTVGVALRRVEATPLGAYSQIVRGVPISNGQAQGIIPAGGALTVTVGPSGLGNVWYPAQATVSTTSGLAGLDLSNFNLYLGPAGIPIQLVGSSPGTGTIALAIPPMSPGQFLIGTWSGARPGDLAALNVIGTMDAIATPP